MDGGKWLTEAFKERENAVNDMQLLRLSKYTRCLSFNVDFVLYISQVYYFPSYAKGFVLFFFFFIKKR